MIEFSYEGNKLKIEINYGLPIGVREYNLRNDLDEIDSVLRTFHLNDALNKNLKQIHEAAYKKGWIDHKRKQPQETFFEYGWEKMK